jgi:hypothetical protein
MKVNDINLKAYESVSRLNNRNNQITPVKTRNESPQKISGASFLDQLNRQEISFLNKNFTAVRTAAVQAADNQSDGILGRRVDVLA